MRKPWSDSCILILTLILILAILALPGALAAQEAPKPAAAGAVARAGTRDAAPLATTGTAEQKPAQDLAGAKSISLPLFFEANEGQADPQVKFLTRTSGYTLFLTPSETVLAASKGKSGKASFVKMQLAGANPSPAMSGFDELPGKVNYLIGNNPAKWETRVPLYSQVRAEQVYPGVDLVFHGSEGQLEYDFVVSPGADPSRIAFRIRGARHTEIDAQGDLVLRAGASEFRMRRPVVYQEIAMERRPIDGRFVKRGRNEIAFEIGGYDRSQPLVIDPSIGYASFLGGTGDDEPADLKVDSSTPNSPKVYVLGITTSITTFPEPSNLVGASGGGEYVYVARVDPTASGTSSLDYLTFVGGSVLLPADSGTTCVTQPVQVALDFSQGSSSVEPVISAATTCADYPGTPLISVQGQVASAATRLNATGTGVDASAVFGGNGNTYSAFATVDGTGTVLVAGPTSSTNFPATSNAYMTQLNNGGTGGIADCFVVLLQRADFSPTYLSYLNVGDGTSATGTTGGNIGCGGFRDASGELDLGGSTVSTDAFHVGPGGANLANGFETSYPTGAAKAAFIMRLDPTKSGTAALLFATYFGGGGTTDLRTGTVDLGNGVAVLAGATTSNTAVGDIPLANAYQTTNLAAANNGLTGFFFVLDMTKTGAASLLTSSYFGGGSGIDQVFAAAYDANDPTAYRILLGGQTASSNFPLVNSLQTLQGAQNAFVAELRVPLEGQTFNSSLYFSTLVGGGARTSGNGERTVGVDVDSNDLIYAAARTISSNFFGSTNPATTVNGFQTTCTSCGASTPLPDTTIFSLGKLSTAALESIAVTPASASISVGQSQQFTAYGYYSDGSIQNITNTVTWISSNTAIATIGNITGNEGLATGVSAGGPITITAQFSDISGTASLTVTQASQFPLTVTEAGTGSGTVSGNAQPQILCPSTCSQSYPSGTQVTLTATPNSGSTFAGWSGNAGCSGTGTCTVTMSAAQSVTATFNATTTFPLTVTEAGTGSGTVSGNAQPQILCPSTCSQNYPSGTQVTLTATAGSGSTFAGWSGNAACSGTGTCTVTMSAAQSVTATFNKSTFTLTVTMAGTGTGTVTSQSGLSPAINCTTGSTTGCTATYPSGTAVTLTEAPASGSTFTSWSLDCGGPTCSFSMTQNQNVTVTFTASGFPLTVTDGGTGSGTVLGNAQPQILCPSTCSQSYPSGTQVTLTATPNSGSTFAGWSGACSGTGTCTVTMSAAESVASTFNKSQLLLTVTLAGTGTGSVSSNPGGITCPDGCSANFNSGSQVTLTETPGTGSNFSGWSGGGCTGTGTTCVVTMSAAETVTATFDNGANFTFTPSVGTSTSVNTSPGGNIVVGLVLSGTVKETVTLGCTSSAPQYLSCLITPPTVNLTGNGTTQVAIVLTSYCQGSAPGGAPGDGPQTPLAPLGILLAIGLTLMLIGMVWSEGNRRRWALTMACLLAMAVTGAACNNLPQGPNGVTPPGTYGLTVTATVAGQPAQAIQINVNVK